MADDLYGRRVGEFVLRDRIGEGGFGAVYRCEQPALGREAVVKVLHHRLRRNQVVRQRFLREAKLASRLDHPYAAHVYAFGAETDGMFWIAMEMVHGTGLDRWLRERGALALDQLVPLFERIAEVVHTAHEGGIVHRDLKPSNIMVIERAGRLLPKLLDFGIAKMLDDTPVAGPEPAVEPEPGPGSEPVLERSPVGATLTLTNTGGPEVATMPERRLGPDAVARRGRDGERAGLAGAALTHTNATLGSPPYMSPEQWGNPLRVGPRSDLYALGVIAYEALTGRRPFVADTVAELAELHCRAEVPSLGPGFPPALDALFCRALAKRTEDRPATALELAEELRVASGLGASTPVAGAGLLVAEAVASEAGAWSARDPQLSVGTPSSMDMPSQAAGTPSRIERPVGRRKWLALGGAAVLVAAGGATGLLATRLMAVGGSRDGIASGEPPAMPIPPPTPATPEPPEPPARRVAEVPAPVPANVEIQIDSEPAGAEVFRWPSEVKVGTTPWHASAEGAEGVAVFVIKKRGRADRRVEVDLRTGGRLRVSLPRVAAPVARPPAAVPAAAPPARRKGEPADPFGGASR